jgi:NSS family neurotransmitter:Na+ symporter
MNQAFFTLSLGIGSMAIFGSYLDKDRSLLGESVNIVALDTFVAITAGLIIFPACFTFDVEPGAGPSLLFVAMAKVFNNMAGGRVWGALFFLFMTFAAMSTVIAVFENILACVAEITGWSRKKVCIICGIAILILSVPCALGFNLWSGFVPFASGSSFLDLEDFLVSNCMLPIGSLCYVLFCVSKKGWGFDKFLEEANAGKGLKMGKWIRPYVTYILPIIISVLFVIGIATFPFADNFTIWDWIKSLIA